MILSDHTLRNYLSAGKIVVDPYSSKRIQPASIDVRVDRKFRVFHNARYAFIDVRTPMENLTELVEMPDDETPFILHPGEFVLGQTLEYVMLDRSLVARLEGKSSLGRLGLLIHSTAGFVDPGFRGRLTLELSNVANLPITIYPGMPIGQISFMEMDREVDAPYGSTHTGSKYQQQTEPTPSKFYMNFPQPNEAERRSTEWEKAKSHQDIEAGLESYVGGPPVSASKHIYSPAEMDARPEAQPMSAKHAVTLNLDPYEAVNLKAALAACFGGTLEEQTPLNVLNTGDWLGQILHRLPDVDRTPNHNAEGLRERARSWWPPNREGTR